MLADKLALLIGISVSAAAWLVGDSADEINVLDLGLLTAILVAVVAVQCTLVWLASRVLSERWLNGLVALLAASNVYHFALVTTGVSPTIHALGTAAAGIAAWLLLAMPARKSMTLLFAAVFTTLSLGQFAYGRAMLGNSVQMAWKPVALPINSDRNVYLISMESLHSPHALRMLYSIKRPPHVDYLKTEGFRVLDKAYAADNHTRGTFQRITEFGKPLVDRREMRAVFSHGNSTFESFHASGYNVQFIYINNYLNITPTLVEHFFPRLGFYICDNVDPQFFYVACRGPGAAVNRWLFGIKSEVGSEDQIAHIKERVPLVVKHTKPWLTMSHIAFPMHTKLQHRFDNEERVTRFRRQARRLMPQIAANYREIVSTIKQQDPEAVIVTFGDHGMWLTRGMETPHVGTFTPAEYLEDRFGVMLGVYPADFCRDRIFEGMSTTFLIRSVVQCLGGDESPSPEEIAESRRIHQDGKAYTKPEDLIAAP